ncbi:hypothetical protein phig1ep40 [Lactobacillus phage phig1e]|uniref:hypothetical protein n=1 Tax=Lactobacillus phage phig1e TaxID=52979 RepID=UPI0001B1BBEC|nr:hypothetical protein phig1ep40 [Lactobacillus phage phig1e]
MGSLIIHHLCIVRVDVGGVTLKKYAISLLNYIKRWMDKPLVDKVAIGMWAVLVIVFLFIFISFTNLLGLGHVIWHSRLFSHLFVDHYGKFNWIGITSILAIATLTFNAWDRRRQFKADLISKSRITWIENVRKATAKYLGTLYAYQKTNNDIKMIMSKRKVRAATSKEEDDFDRLWIKQNDLVINLFEATEQVALYFNKNDEEDRNEKILKLIRDSADKIKADLMQFGEAYNATNTPENENGRLEVWNNLLSITEDVKVSEIGNEISDYLKIEWEKAKNGN